MKNFICIKEKPWCGNTLAFLTTEELKPHFNFPCKLKIAYFSLFVKYKIGLRFYSLSL